MAEKEPIAITGLWIISNGIDKDCLHSTSIEVLLEIDGEWKTILTESTNGPISHIVEPLGIKHYAKSPEWLKEEDICTEKA